MSKDKKWVVSNGFALGGKKDMKKLAKYSRKGWHIVDFSNMGYILEKGEPHNYIYELDYRELEGEDKEEYLEIMKKAGWTPVYDEFNYIILRAEEGTKSIFSDRDSEVEKSKSEGKAIKKSIIGGGIFTAICYGVSFTGFINNDILNNILMFVGSAVLGTTAVLIYTYFKVMREVKDDKR